MKSTVAISQMLMLSTSLLCLSSFAAQNPTQSPTGESQEVHSGAAVGAVIANTTAGQTGAAKQQQQGMPAAKKNMQKKNCMVADNPYRVVLKHIEGKGVGYDQGYTSLDAFFTGNVCNFVPFIDLRAHVFNNGRWAGNAGIGTRYVIDPCKSMLGINAYYDYRKTKHFHYNQVGAGIEAYYDRFEFLANGYLPVGRKRMQTAHDLQSIAFEGFSGNYILYNKYYKNKYEGAMKGFDAEVGGHFAGDMKNYDLYFGIGPYYYDLMKDKHAWGGRARIKLEVSKWLFLEGIDTWDHIFHNRVQGSITFNVPFGVKRCYGKKKMPNNQYQTCDNVMDWLAVLPVDRQEIIVVDKYKKKQTIDPVAIDPTTGNPFFVIFVNNANPNVGDGTFENPYAYLTTNDAAGNPNAQTNSFPDNTIYVFPGDGTNRRQAAGMVLIEGQRMLGSAIAHTYVTTDGVLTIPPQSGKTPFITGTLSGAPGVLIIQNNCEVSGFNIAMQTAFPAGNQALSNIAQGSSDIAVTAGNSITNVTLTNNVCINDANGIFLGDTLTGNIIITDNIISMHEAQSATLNSGFGILGHGNGIANANMLIANNNITFNPTFQPAGTGSAAGISLFFANQVQASILNNTITNMSADGIDVQWTSPTSTGLSGTCIVQNNTFNNIVGAALTGGAFGISSLAPATTPGSIQAIVLNNTILQQSNPSQFFVTSSGPVPNPGLLVRFLDNTIASTSTSTTVNFGTGTSGAAQLWVEPAAGNTCNFTITGTAPIIPIVPCQYGGPGCP